MAALAHDMTLGSGPTVLMHVRCRWRAPDVSPQVESLAAQGWRAVAWDMPGYGHSAPVEPYHFKGLAQACLALIDALHSAPVVLLGHGLGAMLALEAALRAPAKVRRLVLCAGGPPLDDAARHAWLAPRLQWLETGVGMDAQAADLVARQVGDSALPEGVRLAEHALAQTPHAVYRRALQGLPGFARDASVLAQLPQPALPKGLPRKGSACGVAHPRRATSPAAVCAWHPLPLRDNGRHEETLNRLLQALAHVLPDARHVSLPGVGHWPQLEAPEAFDAAVLDFLAQQRTLH